MASKELDHYSLQQVLINFHVKSGVFLLPDE